MSHNPKSVAPEEHPVCCSCADLPLTDMPSPRGTKPIGVNAGDAAITSVPFIVSRWPGADIEHCCWCGVATDQAYFVKPIFGGPDRCETTFVPYRPAPGFLRRLWRRTIRRSSQQLNLLRWLAGR